MLKIAKKSKYSFVKCFCILFFSCLCLTYTSVSFAEISLSKTRLIINEAEKEGNVRILNEGKYPVIIQAWIDTGNVHEAPEHIKVPFIIPSPMFRLEPDGAQLIRVLHVPNAGMLAKDRESVFWLNIQEIPPTTLDKDGNQIQIAFRTRIKLFYRPVIIPIRANDLHRSLKFSWVEKDGKRELQAENTSPIHITLIQIASKENQSTPIQLEEGMISPLENLLLVSKPDPSTISKANQITYTYLNDFGDQEEGIFNFEPNKP